MKKIKIKTKNKKNKKIVVYIQCNPQKHCTCNDCNTNNKCYYNTSYPNCRFMCGCPNPNNASRCNQHNVDNMDGATFAIVICNAIPPLGGTTTSITNLHGQDLMIVDHVINFPGRWWCRGHCVESCTWRGRFFLVCFIERFATNTT